MKAKWFPLVSLFIVALCAVRAEAAVTKTTRPDAAAGAVCFRGKQPDDNFSPLQAACWIRA